MLCCAVLCLQIHIIDAESGVFTGGTEFVTVQNISFHVTKPRCVGVWRV